MINLIKFFSFILFLVIQFSCSPVGIIGGAGTSTMIVAEGDRSLGTVVDDATIKLNVSSKFLKSNNSIFFNIDTSVIEGRVLLIGLVDTQEIRIDAVRKVWEVNGVMEVINEIEVGNKTTIKEWANDRWINSQAKTLAARTAGLRGLTYNFETIKGKVFIAGITSRPEQLQKIIDATKTIKGVKEIINYVIIKE